MAVSQQQKEAAKKLLANVKVIFWVNRKKLMHMDHVVLAAAEDI